MKNNYIKVIKLFLLIFIIFGIFTTPTINNNIKIQVRTINLEDNLLNTTNIFNSFQKYNLNHNEKEKLVNFIGYEEIFLSELLELDYINYTNSKEKAKIKYDCIYNYETENVILNVTLFNGIENKIIDSMPGKLVRNENNQFDVIFEINGETILLSQMYENSRIDNVGFFSSLKRLWNSTIGKIGTIVTVATCAVVGTVCAVIPGAQLATAVSIGIAVGALGFGTTAALVSYKENGTIDWKFVVDSAVAGGIIGGATSALTYTITSKYITRSDMKEILQLADKNPKSKVTFIGKFDKSKLSSYEKVASSKGYNHFNIENSKYETFIKKHGRKAMEEVNKNFLRAKYKAGNKFITNINPYEKKLDGYFLKELEWLKKFGGNYWDSIGDNLWQLIK